MLDGSMVAEAEKLRKKKSVPVAWRRGLLGMCHLTSSWCIGTSVEIASMLGDSLFAESEKDKHNKRNNLIVPVAWRRGLLSVCHATSPWSIETSADITSMLEGSIVTEADQDRSEDKEELHNRMVTWACATSGLHGASRHPRRSPSSSVAASSPRGHEEQEDEELHRPREEALRLRPPRL